MRLNIKQTLTDEQMTSEESTVNHFDIELPNSDLAINIWYTVGNDFEQKTAKEIAEKILMMLHQEGY